MNMTQMMKQAQKAMQEMQQKRENSKYTGKSGGDAVIIEINGQGDVTSVEIAESLMTSDNKEILEDLVVAAFRDAKKKADESNANMMSGAFGGAMPSWMKFPF